MTNLETEVGAAFEAGREQIQKFDVAEHVVFIARPSGDGETTIEQHDLEQYQPHPRRVAVSHVVRDVASFVRYLNRHQTDATVVYAKPDGALVGLMDDHRPSEVSDDTQRRDVPGTPGWGKHRVTLQREQTRGWAAWRSADGMGKAERAVLTVLAQFGPCEKGKLAMLAGYRWSGGFRNTLSALRTAGYIEGPNTGVMTITEGGIAALGVFEYLPTGRDLLDFWLQDPRLGSAERDVLSWAYQVYPDAISGEVAAQETGRQYSGGFRNTLAKLRTAGLIEGSNASFTASPLFFEDGP